MNLDLDNPEQKESIQEALRHGSKSEFWQLIRQRLQRAVDGVQTMLDSEDLVNLIAEEYKIKVEVLKKEKANLTGIMDLPETMVKELDTPEFFNKDEEEDVYLEEKDFKKKQ